MLSVYFPLWRRSMRTFLAAVVCAGVTTTGLAQPRPVTVDDVLELKGVLADGIA
jgi:hypothetical protein